MPTVSDEALSKEKESTLPSIEADMGRDMLGWTDWN